MLTQLQPPGLPGGIAYGSFARVAPPEIPPEIGSVVNAVTRSLQPNQTTREIEVIA